MPEYTVGEGVRYEMERQADRPASHEHYFDGMPWSVTAGQKNLYLYSTEAQRVYVIPQDKD